MLINDFKKALIDIGVKKDSVLFVSSDATALMYDAFELGEEITPDDIINTLFELIGEEGTLIFPTYNWDFCKGKTFDYYKTPSKTGALTKRALKRKEFKRTKHPIYSFAVAGKHQEFLTSLDYKDSFGEDSIFAWFEKIGALNLFINICYEHSATFVHFIEQRKNVPYRFIKEFNANYIDENGIESNRTYSMFVRYLDRPSNWKYGDAYSIYASIVKEIQLNNSLLKLLDMRRTYKAFEEAITEYRKINPDD